MKISGYLILVVFFLSACNPLKDNWEWVNQGGSQNYDGARDIVMDVSGNIYVTGRFQGSALFDKTKLEGAGDDEIFLIKYDPSGKLVWAKRAGGKKEDASYGLSMDGDGNIYMAGFFNDTAYFDKIQIISKGKEDIFIAKFNQNGDVIWCKQAGGEFKDDLKDIVTDNNGNCYITGYFSGSIKFDTIGISGPDYTEDIYIAKYDKNGNAIWAKKAGGPANDRGMGIILDKAENLYLTGYFTKAAYFDSLILNTTDQADIFLAKYDGNGNALWVKQAGGIGWDEAACIDVDEEGNVLIAGFFVKDAMFDSSGNNVLTSFGERDIFIAKYDSKGNFLWVKQAGGEKIDECRSIDITQQGDFYVTGFFGEAAKFDTSTIVSNGDYDIFLAGYNADGTLSFAKQAGGTGYDEGRRVLFDGKQNIFLTGGFNGKAKFGSTETKEAQDFDVFIAKYNLVIDNG